MKKILEYLIAFLLRFMLWFRYRIEVKGLDKLNAKNLNKSGGILFLPNHPAILIDPLAVSLALWPKIRIRPLIIEYMYYTPGIHFIMKMVDALPVPNFDTSANTLKRKRSEQVNQKVINNLRLGQNFMIYPAGQLKDTGKEIIGGASMTQNIIHAVPEANIVLVRTKGLWGSSFSRAYTGRTPPIFPTVMKGIKHVFKNLLFFTPRRKIIVEFHPAPKDFPYTASRLEMNRWLENWYNQPDGLTKQEGELPGDSFIQVSYSMWGEVYPHIVEPKEIPEGEQVNIKDVPEDVQREVIGKLAELTERDPASIKPEMHLNMDLGLDSLDLAEVIAFLQLKYDVSGVPLPELTTVNRLMGIASKKIVVEEAGGDNGVNLGKWHKKVSRPKVMIPEGKTIPEAFINSCKRMDGHYAMGDNRTGPMTYSQTLVRVILLADYIKTLPGQYIGIFLPSSTVATLLILACQLAGKVPLMVNWTIGPRHLESVAELSRVRVILTSWAFLDRLHEVDLTPIEDMLVMLEDVKHKFTLGKKLKALWRSKLSTHSILKAFGADKLEPNSRAVLLFTSGTEAMPKGVPLSHHNLLCNMRGAIKTVEVEPHDIFFGILPPFHAFGFTASSLLAIMAGMRVAFSPNPMEGKKLADDFERWGVTIMAGAPTFIKNMIIAGKPEQFKTMHLCVSGAEKAPAELFNLFTDIGKEGALIEGYGITECSPVLTMNRSDKPPRGVGEPIPGVELMVVHPETLEPLPTGSRGHILAKGPNIFSGYLNPDLASPFETINGEKWYKTGDLGFLDEQNRLIISGRQKRFIKVGGEMVSLAAIEDALLHVAEDRGWPMAEEGPSLAVCAREIEGEKPKIYLFSVFEAELDEVNKAIREAGFSNLVRISEVKQLPEIPVMGSGKIAFRVLENEHMSD